MAKNVRNPPIFALAETDTFVMLTTSSIRIPGANRRNPDMNPLSKGLKRIDGQKREKALKRESALGCQREPYPDEVTNARSRKLLLGIHT